MAAAYREVFVRLTSPRQRARALYSSKAWYGDCGRSCPAPGEADFSIDRLMSPQIFSIVASLVLCYLTGRGVCAPSAWWQNLGMRKSEWTSMGALFAEIAPLYCLENAWRYERKR
jgi:hypothetical protein